MKFVCALLIAAFVSLAASQPVSAHHAAAPVVKPIAKVLGLRHIGGGTGGALVGIFVVGVAVAIIIHEITGPKCARTNDEARLWRKLCRTPSDPATRPIRVRG